MGPRPDSNVCQAYFGKNSEAVQPLEEAGLVLLIDNDYRLITIDGLEHCEDSGF